jgi:hypothetical protein
VTRWNAAFDGMIALTYARGETYDHKKYILFDDNCQARFVVYLNPAAHRRTGVRPQGVITAYPVTPPPTQRVSTFGPQAGLWRDDCPIFERSDGDDDARAEVDRAPGAAPAATR